ncbi:ATP-binding protein [Niveibacterium microcysteis]|uniref:histidine kinase n=1 Tax=Niveibacterium microcysteis TaxID=2811415 RepID=A0ABX7MFT5_9RHOO|nr:ATP-binding protein [Niveibacterium microcysteis]QSI78932.1 Hpt domain-containing protein [Niveibacterium microcysteis]
MLKLGLGKYRSIVVLITLFLVFDVGVLGMTFVISRQLTADAISINLAGQHRYLVQKLAKTALLIDQDATQGTFDSSGRSSLNEVKDLIATADRFNAIINTFDGGAKLPDMAEELALTPSQDEQAAAMFALVKDLWAPINSEVQSLNQPKDGHRPDVGPLLQVLIPNNLNLLASSHLLTSRLEALSAAKAARLRAVQMAGMAAALINFAFILYSFLGQLRKSDQAVERAQRETEDILRTTQEGLFLLDPDFRMGSQTSHALSRIIGVEAKGGENFLDLLKPLVTPKTYDTTKEYIELLLRHDVKEKLVASLNPLDCIEISAVKPSGAVESRFLQIRFNRVLQGNKVTHLLVTVNDITRRVKLERELKDSERRVQDQMGMMVNILQADPRQLQDFLRAASDGLNQINEDLRTASPTTGVSTPRVDAMMRIAHRLKGDAAALQLEAVSQSLHAFENVLQELRVLTRRSSEDLLPVAVRVKGLYAEIAAIQDVIARIGQVRGVVSVEPPKPAHDPELAAQAFVRQWRGFAQQLAQRHEKQVELSYQGLDIELLNPQLRDAVNTTVNQFIRNAVVHGVEKPADRKMRGKSEAGRLSVYVSDQGDGTIELSFRDDGRGINPEKIRAAAIRSGRIAADAAKALDARQLTLMIFEPGLSTRDQVDEDAGRGVGLDAVKDLITRLGGRIRIGTTSGEYCHFRVQLPVKVEPRDDHIDAPIKEVA